MNTESLMQKFSLRQISLKDHSGSWDIGVLKAGVRVWLEQIVSLIWKRTPQSTTALQEDCNGYRENIDNIFLFLSSGDIRYSYHVGQEIVIMTDHWRELHRNSPGPHMWANWPCCLLLFRAVVWSSPLSSKRKKWKWWILPHVRCDLPLFSSLLLQ